MRLHGWWRTKKVAEHEGLLRKSEKEEHESNGLHYIGEDPAEEPVKKGCLDWIIGIYISCKIL